MTASPTTPADPERVERVLIRCLPDARLHRIPRNPDHQRIVLGVICLGMQRRRAYDEQQINNYLGAELARMNALVDHVTCRRYLIDLGFVKRDRAGQRYILNFPKLESALTSEARTTAHRLVAKALKTNARRRRRGPPSDQRARDAKSE